MMEVRGFYENSVHILGFIFGKRSVQVSGRISATYTDILRDILKSSHANIEILPHFMIDNY
jgi:hypothetical protein